MYLKQLLEGKIQGPLTGHPSIDKPWLKYYTDEQIKTDMPQMSAYRYLFEQNKKYLSRTALSYYGRKIIFDEFFTKIEETAKALKAIGVKENDIVTISMPNTPEAAYLFYAMSKIGAIANMVDPRTSAEGLKNYIEEVESNLVIIVDSYYNKVKDLIKTGDVKQIIAISPSESLPFGLNLGYKAKEFIDGLKNSKNKINLEDGTMSWSKFIKNGKEYKLNTEVEFRSNRPLVIEHTGGTTGIPKGVMLTNENLNGLIYQMKYGYDNFHRGQTFLNILPPFIALGLNNAMHLSACLGLKSVMIPTFEPEDIPGLLLKHKPNIFLCGPIHLKVLLKDKNVKNKDLSFIEVICSGGEKMPEKDQEEAQNFLKEHGSSAKMWLGYGATEMSAGISCMKDNAFIYKSVGVPYLQNNIKICDIDTKKELQGYNQTGEVYISGPTLMQDYILSEEYKESEEVIVIDECGTRWYKSKDVGRINEDGMLFIDDRLKRIITRRGFKIYPEHIESIIRQNEYVEDCVVVGIYDEDEISIPVANIVLKEEVKYNEDVKQSIIENTEEIIKASLPSYTVIAGYNFIDKMPLTKIGKTDFVALEKLGIMGEKRNQKIFKMM